jgi:hypothetical protein
MSLYNNKKENYYSLLMNSTNAKHSRQDSLVSDVNDTISKRHKSDQEATISVAIDEQESEKKLLESLFGCSSFHSTKGKKVPGADASAADIIVRRKYTQYMNKKRPPKKVKSSSTSK